MKGGEWLLAEAEVGPVAAPLALDEAGLKQHLEVVAHGGLRPIDGAWLNPARSTGPAVVLGDQRSGRSPTS